MNRIILCLAIIAPSIMAMPKRDSVELFEDWKVAHVTYENEYWAYTEMDSGYKVAFIATRDVVGPGCTLNKLVVLSDTLLNKNRDYTKARLSFGSRGDLYIEGQLINSSRSWASMYSVISADSQTFPTVLSKSYSRMDNTLSLVFTSKGQTNVSTVGRTSGMFNAFNRATDLCREARSKNEIIRLYRK